MELQGQWAELLPRAKQALIDVVDSGRYILGPQVAGLRARRPPPRSASAHAIGVANGTDALAARAARARRRARRPGDLPVVHLLRHGRGDRRGGRDAGVRRHRAPTTTSIRRRSRRALTPRRARWCRPPVRPAGRSTALRALCDRHGVAAAWRTRPRRSAPPGGIGRGRSATSRPSRSSRRRTCRRSATAASITTPRADVADTCRMLRFHGSRDKQTFTQSATTRASTSCRPPCCACSWEA